MKMALALLFLLPSLGFAYEYHPEATHPEKKSTSSAQRQDKEFMLTAQLLGFGPSLATASGLQLAYFLTPDTLIGVEALVGNGTAGLGNFYGDTLGQVSTTANAASAGVFVKRFISNSFYFRGGLDYRRFDYSYTETFYNSSATNYSFNSNSMVATVMIGNQWQFENFTMGCDWFGYNLPFGSNFTGEQYTSNASSQDTSDLNSAENLYVKYGSFTITRFYLGASF